MQILAGVAGAHLTRITKDMTPDEVQELKGQYSATVWAALVFSNICLTPARVLNAEKVGVKNTCTLGSL